VKRANSSAQKEPTAARGSRQKLSRGERMAMGARRD
jgi:hypothetical protein